MPGRRYKNACLGTLKKKCHVLSTSPHNTFTSKHRPWKLIAVFTASEDMATAMKIERFIKKQKSRAFIEKICSLAIVDLPMAQLVKVPQMRD